MGQRSASHQPAETDTDKRKPRLTILIPEILRAKIDAYVERHRQHYARYSLNDFFIAAAREMLDGSVRSATVPDAWEEPIQLPPPDSQWEQRIATEFPKKFIATFSMRNPGQWSRATPAARYEALKAEMERQRENP
jgi:hypothetical protein